MIVPSDNLLKDLYIPSLGDEVIPWSDKIGKYVGISVIKDYPENCGFVPEKLKNGTTDTKVLIKIGFSINEVNGNKAKLYASVSKYKKFLVNRFDYDFFSEDSPTKESVDESARSLQPIDLDDHYRFTFSLDSKEIFDNETKKYLTLNDIIDKLFKLHIATIQTGRGLILKTKLRTRDFICHMLLSPSTDFLVNANKKIFGKEIRKDRDNWLEGTFYPYKMKSLNTVYPQSLPFFDSNIQIAKISIFWMALSILFLWIFVKPLREMDSIFSIALVILLVIFYDMILPRIIILFANILIISRSWLLNKRFRIK